jgi:hypothetical protein
MMRWWHETVLRHRMRVNRMITVPPWDVSAKGELWTCSCGKTWAR